MRILVACSSCWKDLDSNQAIRDTWAKYLPENWDLRFFLGSRNFTEAEQKKLMTLDWIGSPGTLGNLAAPTAKKAVIGKKGDLKADEIIVEAPDSYLGLPFKTVSSLKWALAQGYEGVFRVFVDTYLFPDRLARTDFQKFDCVGWKFYCGPCPAHPESEHLCPLGGAAYWTSKKAMEAILYYTEEELNASPSLRHEEASVLGSLGNIEGLEEKESTQNERCEETMATTNKIEGISNSREQMRGLRIDGLSEALDRSQERRRSSGKNKRQRVELGNDLQKDHQGDRSRQISAPLPELQLREAREGETQREVKTKVPRAIRHWG